MTEPHANGEGAAVDRRHRWAGQTCVELTVPATSDHAYAALLRDAADLVESLDANSVTLSGIDWREEEDTMRLVVYMEDVDYPIAGGSDR